MKAKLLIIINLVMVFFLFMLGYIMTTTPGRSSGNGNPAILLFIPLVILFVVMLAQWIYVFKDKKISFKTIFIGLLLIMSHFLIGINYQLTSLHNYRNFLAQVYEEKFGHIDWPYINSITTGVTIHVNNQYFNINTYLLFVSLSICIFLLYQLVKQILSE
ncbi:hypothetical protein GC093_08565 [Paenibacillus sp. LMG 31456]|uniref:Uncharacterized protein n=1 Tax=Paenibacillus foliorum TaxID=2654974 RepID=A0A972GRS0_9BACL|nr:hypothetical protein [Paenibacillus foliorum]NOU93269.1 hypothetical protein [Paenibacillus foliorum]